MDHRCNARGAKPPLLVSEPSAHLRSLQASVQGVVRPAIGVGLDEFGVWRGEHPPADNTDLGLSAHHPVAVRAQGGLDSESHSTIMLREYIGSINSTFGLTSYRVYEVYIRGLPPVHLCPLLSRPASHVPASRQSAPSGLPSSYIALRAM